MEPKIDLKRGLQGYPAGVTEKVSESDEKEPTRHRKIDDFIRVVFFLKCHTFLTVLKKVQKKCPKWLQK